MSKLLLRPTGSEKQKSKSVKAGKYEGIVSDLKSGREPPDCTVKQSCDIHFGMLIRVRVRVRE